MQKKTNEEISEYNVFAKFRDERMEKIESHLKQVKTDIEQVNGKIDKIYTSVVGNKEMGNIGMAERLDKNEALGKELRSEIDKIKADKIKHAVYIDQAKWLVAIVAALIVIFYIKRQLSLT